MNNKARIQLRMSRDEFEEALRNKASFHHTHHPYYRAMYEGHSTPEQIRGWVANHYYYQVNIPVKDAAILANCPDREVRRVWVQRLLDQDGEDSIDGKIEAWLQLAEAVGLSREEVISEQHVLPGVRFAVDAYVNFARNASWQEATGSSLTELFAQRIPQSCVELWSQNYSWIEEGGCELLKECLGESRGDVEHALRITLDYFNTREQQAHMLDILQFKLDVLWAMQDAMTLAYELERPPYHTIIGEIAGDTRELG